MHTHLKRGITPLATMVLQFGFYFIVLIIRPLYLLASAQDLAQELAQPGCNSTCGYIDIPYPFGMKDPKCYADNWFEIECRDTSQGQTPYLKSINLEVTNIEQNLGTVWVSNPVYSWKCPSKDARPVVNLRGSPFVYSQDYNRFFAFGCNKIAFLQSNGSEVGGCVSICDDNEQVDNNDMDLTSDRCHGSYCCETSLPKYLSEYNATLEDLRNNNGSNQCSYALIARYDSINSFMYDGGSGSFSDITKGLKSNVVAVLEWEILNSTLQLPDGNCHETNITYSRKGHSGRRCQCDTVSYGNPYIAGGCIEFEGFYKKKSRAKWAIVGVLSSLGSIILLIGLWLLCKVVWKRIIKKRKEKFFKQNGGLLLQQRLSSGEVNVDRVKLFSLKDLAKATDHFNINRVLGKGGQGTVYKGMLVDGDIVAVKKFKVHGNVEEFINEFVILSQINHRNVVKLLGCCLETEIPLLVYEFIPNGTLFEYLHEQNEELPMTWDMRLRIAIEVAGALFYLHSAASQPIYHRDIKSTNILLDGKYRAKVADFGTSRMISIEDTHLTTVVQGTFGYLDPEYFHTSQFTEKSDVYSFGVVLVELLTGQKPISSLRPQEAKSLASYFIISMEENRLFDIIDERIAKEGEKEHIVAAANLAKRCLDLNGKKRPTMKEVTMELEGIRRLQKKSDAQQNHEEIELVGIEDCQTWAGYSASNSTGPTANSGTSSSEVMPILISDSW